ncbi:hypothetical protein Desca_1463 [Desulfotomaculum nigrificans CO-1-SRB]|uniref:Uncharacterized protein n=1 Tax=Desulfotomaculum nigrificans (strain DSM 14880 / VKM B-2319 / CO-1-SRB) TaxID=868595 RepID=F6B5Z9_DESCC|nr:hypothetical protein [Desulfotomaculum nigrificans]AEF94318.1 hypothetical protein Desca_1463 [Desulfotomaculum nigrificans CO-1-SRB]
MSQFNWKLMLSTIGFIMIGASMFYPQQKWLIIVGAVLFLIGMIKPKFKKR